LEYCSFCGKKLLFKTLLDGSNEKYCNDCDHVFFDSPSPAIIVAVLNANDILLTRSVGWRHPYWGLIAGHIQSGETAEETTIREVHEEVGLEILNVQILRTYAAKNRNLLMIGYSAESTGKHLKTSKELEKAAWFKLDDSLPLRSNSIANQVVKQIQTNVN
jgi:NAD+ diphosphatase